MADREIPSLDDLVIGILGGTGEQGCGLARRFAMAGHQVIIGSRSHDRAYAVAREIGPYVRGLANSAAAREASLVIAAVPWEGHAELLSGLTAELAGKIMVDCVNPLGFDQRGAYPLRVAEGSAAEQAARLLPDSRVVAAFHHVSAVLLLIPRWRPSTWTCSCSATTVAPPTRSRPWRPGFPACAASTRAASATAARSKR